MEHSYTVLARLLDNKWRVWQHVVYVLLIFLFWFLFIFNKSREPEYIRATLFASTYVIVAYINIYVLFKNYLLKGRFFTYALVSLLTFISSYIVQGFIYFRNWEQMKREFTPSWALLADFMINIITYYMFIGIGLSVKTLKLWLNSERRVMALEQESLRSKLNLLRSQVSPHFLFNTFNNLYVLTKTNPALASEMVLGFSDLMRYQLTECEDEKVSVLKELEYIHNFLALEKLRKDNLEITCEYNARQLEGTSIEPLLLVTFVENAVKHGSQQMEKASIHVSVNKSGNEFSYTVKNTKPAVPLAGMEKNTGKGLENLRARLNLLYPGAHRIELKNNPLEFCASMTLTLV